jgi:membrane protein implicated in regulation of membrane protease activity
MTKAESKALGGLFFLALIVGGPIYLVNAIGTAIGWGVLGSTILAIAIATVLFKILRTSMARSRRERETAERLAGLIAKYGDVALVDRIMSGKIWQGQSEEQLIDSIGSPADVDERLYKTKKSQTWKYRQLSPKRFGLKVMLEDGCVVGWDQKG